MSKYFKGSRGRVATATTVLLLSALTACGGGESTSSNEDRADADGEPTLATEAEWTELLEQAEAEGEVIVYSSAGATDVTFELFQETYPEIDVKVVREPTADLIGRMDLELQSGSAGADVAFLVEPGWYETAVDQEQLITVTLSPESQESGWADEVPMGSYYVPIMRNPFVLGYNSDLVDPVTTVEEILEQAGDSPIGITEPTIPAISNQYQTWMKLFGDDFLERIGELNASRYHSTTPMAQSLAAGEIAYGFPFVPGLLGPLQAQGAPVVEVLPEDGTNGFQYGFGIPTTSGNPHAAQVFVNWLLSPATQALLVERHGPVAVPLDVEGALEWDSVTLVDPEELTIEDHEDFVRTWETATAG